MSDSSRSARLLRAALGQDGPIEPAEADWNEWVELARIGRVLPLLHHVATTTESDLTDAQLEMATEIQLDVMGTMVRFEHDLLNVAEVLSNGDLTFAVLKGAATAHLDYVDPSLRQYGDVDLLVAPEEFDRARERLKVAGWRQAYPLPRHHERFTHAITLRNSRRVEVDLHQRVAHRAIGQLVPTQDLLDDAVEYLIAGRSLWGLSKRDRLIHAALHTLMSRGQYRRLSSTADVLVLADANSDAAGAALARAESWRVRSLVERAIGAAYSDARLAVPDAWLAASSKAAYQHDRLVDRAYLSPRRRPVIEELAYLRLMHGWRDRTMYVRGYFSTDAEYSRRNRRSGFIAQSRYLWSKLRSGPPA